MAFFCSPNDIKQLGLRWREKRWGPENKERYCKFRYYDNGNVYDGFFSYEKDNDTHIHVFWSDNNSCYMYQLKCNGEHMGNIEMYNVDGDGCDIDDYISEFEDLLRGCFDPDSVGGFRKKTLRKRRGTRKVRKTRGTRKHRKIRV